MDDLQVLLSRGLVVDAGDVSSGPRSVHVIVRVNASVEDLFKVLSDPLIYSSMLKDFRDVSILDRSSQSVAYQWKWHTKFVDIRGRNAMILYPSRRVDMRILDSDVGTGSLRWDLSGGDAGPSILSLKGQWNFSKSNWFLRMLFSSSPGMEKAALVGAGILFALSVKKGAESLGQGKPIERGKMGKGGSRWRRFSSREFQAMDRLLGESRDAMILVESHKNGRLGQTTVFSRSSDASGDLALSVGNPGEFEKRVPGVIRVKDVTKDASGFGFSWTMGLPFLSISSRNQLIAKRHSVLIKSLEGDLSGSEWRYQSRRLKGTDRALSTFSGWANLMKGPKTLRGIVKREPFLEHGLNAAACLILSNHFRQPR